MTRTCPETNHFTTVLGSLRLFPMPISISNHLKPFSSWFIFNPLKLIIYVPPCVTQNILSSAFRVQLCLVRLREQAAITYLHSINRFVFITEMERVYCAVQTESLITIQVKLNLRTAKEAFLFIYF
jgi:hypothetical protein